MKREYTDRIRCNLVYIVDQLHFDDISTAVKQYQVLTKRMMEEVEVEKLPFKKNQLFFNLLEKRPDNTFEIFCRILRENCQEHIANVLDPRECWVPHCRPQQQYPTPTLYSQHDMCRTTEIPVQPSDAEGQFYKDVYEGPSSACGNVGDTKPIQPRSKPEPDLDHPWPNSFLGRLENLDINMDETDLERDPEVYEMLMKPRGLCMIINNVDFVDMPRRNGSDVDAHNLQLLFRALDFDVREYKNLRKKAFVDKLIEFAKDSRHGDGSCMVLAILSHGKDEHIYSTDGDTVLISDMVSLYNGEQCPNLFSKPKIFILQACRGEKYDPGVRGDHLDGKSETDANQVADILLKKELKEERSIMPKNLHLPTNSDMLMAFATLPGYVSWRNSERGSWFIQAIVQTVRDYAHREHLMDMLTMVNDKVATAFKSSTGSYKSMPQPVSMLRKKLYFFPKKNA